MRTCQKCGCLKNFSEFVRRVDRPGYYRWCRQCQALHGRASGWPPSDICGAGTADGGMKNLLETE